MGERISLDEHQDSLLTDEERAAIADDVSPPGADAAAEDKGAKAAADADAGDDEGEDDDDAEDDAADGDDADEASTAAADSAAAAPAPAAPAAEAVDDDDDEPALPAYQVALPEDFDAKVAANKAALTALRAKRDEGDISNAEFDAQAEILTDERDELRRLQARHDVAEDMRKQTEQARVNAAWGRTLKAAEADGIDYRKDKAKHADFDLMIKALAKHPDNNDKPLKWFFAEAHKRVLALHGVTGKTPAPTPTTPADKRKAASDARKPDLTGLPKTLADVPGDDGPGSVDGDEFSDIDDLSGLAYEDALAAKMKRDPGFASKYTAGVKGSGRKAARTH